MIKINDNSTAFRAVYILILLVIFTLGAMSLPNSAQAEAGYVDNPMPIIDSISQTTGVVILTGYGFLPSSVVKINGATYPSTFIDYSNIMLKLNGNIFYGPDPVFITVFNGFPGGGYSNAVAFKKETGATVLNSNNNNNNSSYSYENNGAQRTDNKSTNTNETASSLVAGAILGTNSFLPSGLIQWVFFGIIALLIVIIVRKISGASERYHNSPLKHP